MQYKRLSYMHAAKFIVKSMCSAAAWCQRIFFPTKNFQTKPLKKSSKCGSLTRLCISTRKHSHFL